MTNIDLNLLETVFSHMAIQGVRYKLGAKAPSLDCDTSQISEIDCSGFVRFAIAKATSQQLIIPDGLVNQRRVLREPQRGLLACLVSLGQSLAEHKGHAHVPFP